MVDADLMQRFAPSKPAPAISHEDVARAVIAAGSRARNEPAPSFVPGPPRRQTVQVSALDIVNASRRAAGQPPLKELPHAGPKQRVHHATAQEILNAGNAARQPRG